MTASGEDNADQAQQQHAPRLTIVTVNLNNRAGLRATLESIEAQDQTLPIEVVVVDGASSDGSLDELAVLKKWPPVVVSERDQGIFDGQNKGLDLARGDYVLFLNSGDFLADPDALTAAIDALGDSPIWVLGGCVDLKGGTAHVEFDHFPASWLMHAQGRKFYCQQSILYSTAVLRMMGGHDWEEVGNGADFDMNLRLGLLASPKELHRVITHYEGAGMSASPAFRVSLPGMMHDIRKLRLQLTGPLLLADKLMSLAQAGRRLGGNVRRRLRSR